MLRSISSPVNCLKRRGRRWRAHLIDVVNRTHEVLRHLGSVKLGGVDDLDGGVDFCLSADTRATVSEFLNLGASVRK
jgi:hypothetical protein